MIRINLIKKRFLYCFLSIRKGSNFVLASNAFSLLKSTIQQRQGNINEMHLFSACFYDTKIFTFRKMQAQKTCVIIIGFKLLRIINKTTNITLNTGILMFLNKVANLKIISV